MTTPALHIQRAADRFHTRIDWLDSWHSFSFGHHYDPARVGHGLLIVNNDDRVAPLSGFGTHPHRDMEIVTWVLSGRLEHADTLGNRGTITPGLAQRMSAGTGIRHSEMNASPTDEVHFLQMWVLPDAEGVAPGYEQAEVSTDLDGGGLVRVAGGPGTGSAITVHQAAAALHVARLGPGASVDVPGGPHSHLFVPVGAVSMTHAAGVEALEVGDAAMLTGSDGVTVEAGPSGAEILVWVTA
jgi:redox-sensitive bicupin YhaK (pirin superfamily)